MSKAQAKGKKIIQEDSSDEEEEVVQKKVKTSNTKASPKVVPKKKVESSDESEEEEIIKPSAGKGKVAQKVAQKANGKKVTDGDTSDTSEEAPKKATKAAPAKTQAAKKKQVESEEDSDEEPAPPKKATPKAAPAKAQTSAKGKKVAQDSDESEEEVKPAKTSKQTTPKVTPKIDDSISEEDSEEEVKPKNKGKQQAPAKTQPRKSSKVVEEEEEEEEEESTPKAKTPVQSKQQVPQENGGAGAPKGAFEVIIKGLPFTTSDNDLRESFAECGNIERVNLLKGPDGRSKGIAFLSFSTEEAVKAALAFSNTDFGGRTIVIEKTTPREQRAPTPARDFGQKSERDPNSASIFVGNLSYQTTEDSLRAFFGVCGQILGARVATDQEGNPRGFAHVDFASPDSVDKAIAKAGSNLDGRPVRVDYSAGKKNDGGNRGGQRGGFGGGYGGGNFSGQKRGPPGGNRMNLSEDDSNRKKGSIGSFSGSKQRL